MLKLALRCTARNSLDSGQRGSADRQEQQRAHRHPRRQMNRWTDERTKRIPSASQSVCSDLIAKSSTRLALNWWTHCNQVIVISVKDLRTCWLDFLIRSTSEHAMNIEFNYCADYCCVAEKRHQSRTTFYTINTYAFGVCCHSKAVIWYRNVYQISTTLSTCYQ